MKITNTLHTITQLQNTSKEVFKAVAKRLRVGDSEANIADYARQEFAKLGITEFWYDIPIIVLIDAKRLIDGSSRDYSVKSPSVDYLLKPGSVLYIDMHPQDPQAGQWGDWNTMAVFQPRAGVDDEQVAFLEEVRDIHRKGIAKLNSDMTGADVVHYFFDLYKKHNIDPLVGETQADIGHTIHTVPKLESHRQFLSTNNHRLIGGLIYTVEPGGSRVKQQGGGIVVGRFEECVYIPSAGQSVLLGNGELVPLVI